MKYVILKQTHPVNGDRVYPFLFSNGIAHDEMAEACARVLRLPTDEHLHIVTVYSAGSFTPETGAIRGARALDILQGEASDDLSQYDDFLINTHDQTKGKMR